MGIELKKGENVFYPAPYVPSEPALIIITDKRVVYFGDDGRQEMEANKVSFVGRISGRPFLVACILMALIGLPLAGYGAWMWYSVKDMKTFAESPPMTEEVEYEDPAITRIKAIVIGGLGAVLAVGAWYLIKRKRYYVVVRGGQELIRLRVPDEMKQTQIIMTIQAMQQAAKAMKAAPKPADPKPASS
jgi:hypothetical protein